MSLYAKCQIDWASINLGVLLCLECSGVHRHLGVAISKVRSLSLDEWENGTLEFMLNIGNQYFNTLYESDIEESQKISPSSEQAERELYIKQKYAEKKYMAPVQQAQLPQLQSPSSSKRIQRTYSLQIVKNKEDTSSPISFPANNKSNSTKQSSFIAPRARRTVGEHSVEHTPYGYQYTPESRKAQHIHRHPKSLSSLAIEETAKTERHSSSRSSRHSSSRSSPFSSKNVTPKTSPLLMRHPASLPKLTAENSLPNLLSTPVYQSTPEVSPQGKSHNSSKIKRRNSKRRDLKPMASLELPNEKISHRQEKHDDTKEINSKKRKEKKKQKKN